MTARFAAALLFFAATTAHADADRCRAAIVKASAKHAQAAEKIFQTCADRVLASRLPASTDCRADPLLPVAATKLHATIARACCGADATCGTADDEPLAGIGWNVGSCPDFESVGCDAPIASADDVATCLACVGVAAADRSVALAAGEPKPPGVSCRRAMAREATRFTRATAKALAHCWAATNPCPDALATAAIEHARARMVGRVCSVCGGADGQCGGGDDVSLADVAAPAHCPAVTVPGGEACGGTIGALADLVGCVGCVGLFGATCVDRAAVPAFASYPAECDPPAPTCSAGVQCETSLDCPPGYECRDNGGRTLYCVGAACTTDADCGGGGVCGQYCTTADCAGRSCQCPGFACSGPNELCLDDGGLACRKLCTQD